VRHHAVKIAWLNEHYLNNKLKNGQHQDYTYAWQRKTCEWISAIQSNILCHWTTFLSSTFIPTFS
ncbi:MAG: hypothetical protein ACK53Y_23420, partial [bacterium]